MVVLIVHVMLHEVATMTERTTVSVKIPQNNSSRIILVFVIYRALDHVPVQ